MDEDKARRRFAAARVGRLGTITPSGAPHLVPVVFAQVDDVLYTAVDRKPKTTMALQRLANINATGSRAPASVLVDHYCEDWAALWWVRADGLAEVLTIDQGEPGLTVLGGGSLEPGRIAVEALTLKYPQYVGQPPPGPVIAVRLTRWRWWEATPTP